MGLHPQVSSSVLQTFPNELCKQYSLKGPPPHFFSFSAVVLELLMPHQEKKSRATINLEILFFFLGIFRFSKVSMKIDW